GGGCPGVGCGGIVGGGAVGVGPTDGWADGLAEGAVGEADGAVGKDDSSGEGTGAPGGEQAASSASSSATRPAPARTRVMITVCAHEGFCRRPRADRFTSRARGSRDGRGTTDKVTADFSTKAAAAHPRHEPPSSWSPLPTVASDLSAS